MSDDKLNGNANMVLHNRTRNIMRLDGYNDASGKPLVLGTEADRGIVGAPQPEATVKVSELRKMMENPALAYMLDEGKELEAKRPFSL